VRSLGVCTATAPLTTSPSTRHRYNTARTPLDPNVKLDMIAADYRGGSTSTNNCNAREYQSIIGSLMYLALGTRPNIAFAVAALSLSRYSSDPKPGHMTAAKRVLRYVKATADATLHFLSNPSITPDLLGYSDLEFAGDSGDRKSQGGHVF
jgi:hypothetical protein